MGTCLPVVSKATEATPPQEHAQLASLASGNLQQAMVIARPAARASTGNASDKPLKRRARPVARVSTVWKQEELVKHRARPVPRTRTRFLRVVLELPALATQATRATLAQEHAQCA
jgi:hypothetical protein